MSSGPPTLPWDLQDTPCQLTRSVCLSVPLSTLQKNVSWAPGAAGAPARTMGRHVARPGAWRPGCGRLAGPGRRRQQPARCCLSQGSVPSRGPAQQVSTSPHSGLQQAGPLGGGRWGAGEIACPNSPCRAARKSKMSHTFPWVKSCPPWCPFEGRLPCQGQSQLREGYVPAFIRTSLPFQNDCLPFKTRISEHPLYDSKVHG